MTQLHFTATKNLWRVGWFFLWRLQWAWYSSNTLLTYGPRSGFSYYNLAPSSEKKSRGLPLFATRGRAVQLCELIICATIIVTSFASQHHKQSYTISISISCVFCTLRFASSSVLCLFTVLFSICHII